MTAINFKSTNNDGGTLTVDLTPDSDGDFELNFDGGIADTDGKIWLSAENMRELAERILGEAL